MLHLTAVDDFDTDGVHQCKPSKNDGIPYIFISTQYIFCARSSTETILKMIFSLANVNNNNANRGTRLPYSVLRDSLLFSVPYYL